MTATKSLTALIIGASRGLGLGLVRELAERGWQVTGTVRRDGETGALLDLSAASGGRVEVEHVDIAVPKAVASLRQRLEGRRFDLLFVNAGIANPRHETVGEATTEAFTEVLVTNTLSPLRVLERFKDLVSHDGVIGVMSSGLGSVANNTTGGWEVYRASKAGLNTLMRSFAARHSDAPWALMTIAPGWVRTDMGTADAPLDIETSMRGVASVLEGRHGQRGLAFLNYQGETLPW